MDTLPSDSKSESVKLLAVNLTHAYHVTGLINGTIVCFVLATGASVNLLKDDVWCHVAGDRGLSAWSGLKLVGVEGTPISIFCTANIDVVLSGVQVKGDFLHY